MITVYTTERSAAGQPPCTRPQRHTV